METIHTPKTGTGFDGYRQAAEAFRKSDGGSPVTPLAELAAEVEYCSGAARMLAQGIAGGMDLLDLEGAAGVLAARLDALVLELGALEEPNAGGDA